VAGIISGCRSKVSRDWLLPHVVLYNYCTVLRPQVKKFYAGRSDPKQNRKILDRIMTD